MLRWLLVICIAGCGPSDNFRDPQGHHDLSYYDGQLDLSINYDFPPPQYDAYVITDPKTCAEAAMNKSYVGCDYWPTVTANSVWSIFDFGVVVANAGDMPADVTVTGPNSVNQTATVPPSSLVKFYLPWVPALKGLDMDQCATPVPLTATARAPKGAYHLTSTLPVIVYQFNALEYKGAGGPPAKAWNNCPGTVTKCGTDYLGCYSFTNDASLLLPSTALTGNYRVTGQHGESSPSAAQPGLGAYMAITGTADTTHVTVKVSSKGNIVAGGGVPAVSAGQSTTFVLNQGDVMELLADASDTADLSGSLVQADKPVQVIVGNTCFNNPANAPACDHLESAVFPAETLGTHYIVSVPTAPNGDVKGHTVRLYGNSDNTMLSFNPPLPGAPTSLNAGQVVDLGQVTKDFEIQATHELAVASFQLGGSVVDPQAVGSMTPSKGDPSQSLFAAVEQYRLKYVFLAPDDYDVSYADVQAPMGATLILDGAMVTQTASAVGTSGFGVYRIPLGAGTNGAHVLSADQPIGLQVIGYGAHTSYQVPGGVNLLPIAPPPVM